MDIQRSQIIDSYAVETNYYPHIPYEPVGAILLEEASLAEVGIALASALCEHESGLKNLFGADRGGPFAHERVTEVKVHWLMGWNAAGGTPNGVGITQLTYPFFVIQAEQMGGAHLPRYQCRVGFSILADYIYQYGGDLRRALGAYNGGPSNPNYTYADSVLAKRDEWRRRFRA